MSIDGLIKGLDQLIIGFQNDPTATLEGLERSFIGLIEETE